jgi:hypothetical protein
MRICVLTVNHGTTPYAELLLASLLHHHDREDLDIVRSPAAVQAERGASGGTRAAC